MQNWMKLFFEKLKKKKTLLFTSVFMILIFTRIWLITGVPKLFLYGPHDDLFFAKAAHYIIHGQWMGAYTQMTLIKTPFYSFFLIFSYLTGLPLFLNETLFYVLACLVLYIAFSPLIQERSWLLLLFTLILYSPAYFLYLRVYREFVYLSLTLYVVAFSIGLFLRLDQKISKLLLWSFGLGLSMGAFMITREEGIWIYPILFLFLFGCLLYIWIGQADRKMTRSMLVLLPILLWYIPSTVVSSLNYSYYGFWGTTERLDPDLGRILNTLERIKSDTTWHPLVVITKQARMKAYKASPIFNELKDPIERSMWSWNAIEELTVSLKPDWYLKKYGNDGKEISNDYFLFVLRNAVYDKGYYAEGKYPHDFYRQLADQLESACENGKLNCSPAQNIPLIGAVNRRHFPIITRMFFENILHLLNLDYIGVQSLEINTWPTWPENNDEYKYFEELVYNPLADLRVYSGQDVQYLVNGNMGLRLKMLLIKGKLMTRNLNLYKRFTLPLFVIAVVAWIYLLISTKREWLQESYVIISVFIIGLFFSRLMVLTIIDATTATPGILYGASIYLFIYIFSFLMLHWVVKRLTMILRRNGIKTISSQSE